jgi:hypothetical protein
MKKTVLIFYTLAVSLSLSGQSSIPLVVDAGASK